MGTIRTQIIEDVSVYYKWRKEVFDYLKIAPNNSGTTTDLSNHIINRDRIVDEKVQKEIRNKMSITLATLFRDDRILREKPEGDREYIYKLKTDMVLNESEGE